MGVIDDEVARLITERPSFFRDRGPGVRTLPQSQGEDLAASRGNPAQRAEALRRIGVEGGAQFMNQFRARQEASQNAASERKLNEITGKARLRTAQAALIKARGGDEPKDIASREALEVFNLDPNLKISDANARQAGRLKESKEGREQRESRLRDQSASKVNRLKNLMTQKFSLLERAGQKLTPEIKRAVLSETLFGSPDALEGLFTEFEGSTELPSPTSSEEVLSGNDPRIDAFIKSVPKGTPNREEIIKQKIIDAGFKLES